MISSTDTKKTHFSAHRGLTLRAVHADEPRHTEPQTDQTDTFLVFPRSVPAGAAIALNRSAGRPRPVCTRLTLALESH